ncbi:MAG: 4Fe-4S dicluster domain-containing protein [Firmicutes bacterium]|nr:4Fe-4S dicluster domain-containing protein [Bacillota bacterium]
MQLNAQNVRSDLIKKVEEISGQKVLSCYQCGKCSAGCPMGNLMDRLPHEIMRLLQLGAPEEAADSLTIWLCASCQTCASRCPRNVDLARVMEAVRVTILRKGIPYLNVSQLPPEVLERAPQQALVSGCRKFTF